jgi:signal transduction histidine kinase/AraC-like DNA-binding protein
MMPHTPRVGIQIRPDDPFWVQVREVIGQQAQAYSLELVELAVQDTHLLTRDGQLELVEDLVVQEIDALISNTYPHELLSAILDRNIPIVYVSEIALRHPRFVSRLGLYDAGSMIGAFLHERLAGCGNLLIAGGLSDGEDNGQSRLDGFFAALPTAAGYTIHHVPSDWESHKVRVPLVDYLARHPDLCFDAVFGLSDSLALGARDVCQSLGRVDDATLVVGVNGDPLALAAIADGRMAATVETDVDDIVMQAVELACRAARGEVLPTHFQNRQRLVTRENIAEVATGKLLSLAGLPSRLVGVNRRTEQQRVVQLETSLAITRQIGQLLDRKQLLVAITGQIRDSYGFDHARFLVWDGQSGRLAELGGTPDNRDGIAIDVSGPLAYALAHDRIVFIPDTQASHRFVPDPLWPALGARVVAPVHLGDQVVGLLDLHRRHAAHYTREELDGFQLLADQLGIAMRNAELYGQALDARVLAEKADQLKTVLLANVSHEFRTPLNVILGYSQATLDSLAGGSAVPTQLCQDVTQIYRSGQHLLRLINDLLDVSRAEIGELDLLPERIETRGFLEDVFQDSARNFGAGSAVDWRLELPPELPPITADPVRLRQVLLNLLHNAHKFTQRGRIVLGAAVASTEVHLWIADTGAGIAEELREQIFAPFMSVADGARRREGIGLGLSIARRLVDLHHGRMLIESQVEVGSTFHIYLPLLVTAVPEPERPSLLLISAAVAPPERIVQLAERRNLELVILHPGGNLSALLARTNPALLAWDLATASDNWRLIEQIRAHPPLGGIPLVLYHGEADAASNVATGLLVKPLSDNALVETLESLEPNLPGGSILIVEDDQHIRALHRRVVAEHFPSYAIREAGDGRAALEILASEIPSLIVLDLVMPDIDGFGVLKALRGNPSTAAIPVLVLSGRALSTDDVRQLGASRVIFQTKDILAEDELAEALRRTLRRDDLLPRHTSALVKRAIACIQQRYNEPLSRQEIADAVGVSKDYLGRIFHQELGLSPWEYLIRYRVLRAKELLLTTSYSVAEVATRVGFDTATYFSHIFHREVGCSPRAFRVQPPTAL